MAILSARPTLSYFLGSLVTCRDRQLTQTTCDKQCFAGDPFGIVGSEEYRSRRDIVRLPDSTERGHRFEHVSHIAFMKSGGNYSLCNHHPGPDCVYADFAWAEFLRQRPRDRVDRALRCVVNNRSRWSQERWRASRC